MMVGEAWMWMVVGWDRLHEKAAAGRWKGGKAERGPERGRRRPREKKQ